MTSRPRSNGETRGRGDVVADGTPRPRVVASGVWRTAQGDVRLDAPVLMGILNVTPDSFYDGGAHTGVDAAVAHAARLIAEGAEIIDVGGESTRPNATAVPAGDELARVLPVVRRLVREFPDTLVSIDTVKSEVASAAVAEGAAIVNDVSGLRVDARIADAAAANGAGLVLMHSRGAVDRMASYELAQYGDDPVAEMIAELRRSIEIARAAGVADACIALDPGLGFSKRTEHSIRALAQLTRFSEPGLPLLVGPSRKRFVGEAAGGLPPEQRLEGTIAACVLAYERGARIFRVHDVAPVRRALLLAAEVGRVSE